MPDKRQTSKQRRASRNRAQREAIAARRQNAEAAATRAPATRSSGTTTSSAATSTGRGGKPRTGRKGRRPGDTAVLVSLLLAVAAFVATLSTSVQLDDRGEPVPPQFGGLVLDARATLTGSSVVDDSENIISAYGASIIALIVIPVLVVLVTFVLNRRLAERNRLFTISMLALAGVVVLTGGFGLYYMPALIALAVGSFQVRKVEMPARMAQRAARTPAGKGVVDVDEVDAEEADDEAPAATPARSTRSRRSGSAKARPEAIEAEVVDADVVDASDDVPVADEAVTTDETSSAAPSRRRTARSSSNRLRRSRSGGATDAPAEEPADAAPADEPVGNGGPVDEVAPASPALDPPPSPAADADVDTVPEPAADDSPDHDDILAELEEELRRESEAEGTDDDTPNRKRR